MKPKTVFQIVRRARDPEGSKMEFGAELRDFLSMHFVKAPATDMDLPWVYKHNFCDDEGKQFYGWTTNRMLESCHFWLQANDQVEDGVGEVFISFDSDHYVIAATKKRSNVSWNHRNKSNSSY